MAFESDGVSAGEREIANHAAGAGSDSSGKVSQRNAARKRVRRVREPVCGRAPMMVYSMVVLDKTVYNESKNDKS